MDQGLFDDCTTAYRAERMKEKKVLFWSLNFYLSNWKELQERENAWRKIHALAMQNPVKDELVDYDSKFTAIQRVRVKFNRIEG